jgi:hypothetical protein
MGRHTGSKKTAGGLSKIEPFYQVFNGARCRCTDPTKQDYSRYGGRGLTFSWDNYLDFKRDMYESYLVHKKEHPKDTSLERIDNNKGYSKENCRWATMREQSKNRRTNRYFTYKGETLIIADWARKLGVSRQAVRYRIESGWSFESIIKIPFSYSNRYDKKNDIVTSSKKNS